MKLKKPKFAKLEMKMVYSKAFNDLNAPAHVMLSYLLLQLKWVNVARSKDKPKYVITNKREVTMPYSILNKPPFKLANSSIVRGIDSLLAHGFISVERQGGKAKGHPTIYAWSDKWETWINGKVVFSRKPFFRRGFCA